MSSVRELKPIICGKKLYLVNTKLYKGMASDQMRKELAKALGLEGVPVLALAHCSGTWQPVDIGFALHESSYDIFRVPPYPSLLQKLRQSALRRVPSFRFFVFLTFCIIACTALIASFRSTYQRSALSSMLERDGAPWKQVALSRYQMFNISELGIWQMASVCAEICETSDCLGVPTQLCSQACVGYDLWAWNKAGCWQHLMLSLIVSAWLVFVVGSYKMVYSVWQNTLAEALVASTIGLWHAISSWPFGDFATILLPLGGIVVAFCIVVAVVAGVLEYSKLEGKRAVLAALQMYAPAFSVMADLDIRWSRSGDENMIVDAYEVANSSVE